MRRLTGAVCAALVVALGLLALDSSAAQMAPGPKPTPFDEAELELELEWEATLPPAPPAVADPDPPAPTPKAKAKANTRRRPKFIEDFPDDDSVWPLPRNLRRICRPASHSGSLVRCLPNVMFVGTSKCGTTSMNWHLYHARGVLAQNGETDLLERYSGAELREREFLRLPAVRDDGSGRVPPLVHYRPRLLSWPRTPARIRDSYPHWRSLRFIVMLREPTARAVSSYWFKTGRSAADGAAQLRVSMRMRREFAACATATARREPGLKRASVAARCRRGRELPRVHAALGFYADMLRQWFQFFDPAQFLVLSLEEFQADPERATAAVLRFIGVSLEQAYGPLAFSKEVRVVSNGHQGKKPDPISPAVIAELDAMYARPNKELVQLLGKDFGY